MNYEEYIEKHPKVKLSVAKADSNPNMQGEMPEESFHWLLTLSGGHGECKIPYSTGPGLVVWKKPKPSYRNARFQPHIESLFSGYKPGKPAIKPYKMSVYQSEAWPHMVEPETPTLELVLECLSSDWASIENSIAFADWAEDLGYSSDSIKAEKAYRATQDLALACRKAIGWQAYSDAMEIEW